MATSLTAGKGIVHPSLRVAHLPRPAAQQAAFSTALRLLATWAVRATTQQASAAPTEPISLCSTERSTTDAD